MKRPKHIYIPKEWHEFSAIAPAFMTKPCKHNGIVYDEEYTHLSSAWHEGDLPTDATCVVYSEDAELIDDVLLVRTNKDIYLVFAWPDDLTDITEYHIYGNGKRLTEILDKDECVLRWAWMIDLLPTKGGKQ